MGLCHWWRVLVGLPCHLVLFSLPGAATHLAGLLPPPGFPLGGWTPVYCASTSRTTLCLRRLLAPSCAVVVSTLVGYGGGICAVAGQLSDLRCSYPRYTA